MKLKIKNLKKVLVAIILAAVIISQGKLSAQGLWQAIGNDTVFTNREVKVNKNINLFGELIAHSGIKGKRHF